MNNGSFLINPVRYASQLITILFPTADLSSDFPMFSSNLSMDLQPQDFHLSFSDCLSVVAGLTYLLLCSDVAAVVYRENYSAACQRQAACGRQLFVATRWCPLARHPVVDRQVDEGYLATLLAAAVGGGILLRSQ